MAYVQGKAEQSTNGLGASARIAVQNPATGEVVAHVPDLTAEQVAELAARGRAAQPAWQGLGFDGRARDLFMFPYKASTAKLLFGAVRLQYGRRRRG